MMSSVKQRLISLRAQKGETLVETLVAIMITAFAITALSTGVAASAKLNGNAHAHEAAIRTSVQAAERAAEGDVLGGGAAQVAVTSGEGESHSYTVTVYGVPDGEGGKSEVVSYSYPVGE